MTNTTTETKTVTMKELVAAFEGKYVNISPTDHYGIAIEIHKGTIEYEDEIKTELWLVSRDSENNVTSSLCIDEDSIEGIEEYNGTYTIRFTLCMADIDISEHKTVE